jgi:hypothetical protein
MNEKASFPWKMVNYFNRSKLLRKSKFGFDKLSFNLKGNS